MTNKNNKFKAAIYKAERQNVKASIMIEGLTGTGKTGLALAFAEVLSGGDWDKVGMVDTENKSSNLYQGNKLHTGAVVGKFPKIDLTQEMGYAPLNYMGCLEALRANGASVVIEDSITHAWQREGGVLDMVNKVEQNTRNKFQAWGDPEVVLNKNAMFTMLRNEHVHLITTVRVKEKFGLEFDDTKNKNTVVSLGEQQQTQEGVKYEPDLVLKTLKPGSPKENPVVFVVKSRYPMLEKDQEYEMTRELMLDVKNYLEEGADPEELIARQKESYMEVIMETCKAVPQKKALYDIRKKQMGLETVKLEDMDVKHVKDLYLYILTD